MAGKEYSFGEFRLRPQQRELLRNGQSIRLEKIPFDLLVLLVERAGELIPRDEIATKIWQGSFQDIDASLNTAVRKLRVALRDQSERPRFVRTIVGQGYRFSMPVEVEDTGAEVLPVTADPVPTTVIASPKSQHWRRKVAVVLVGILAAVSCWFVLRRWLVQDIAMVAVLPFEDFGEDASQRYFSQGITDEIITQLGRTASSGVGVIAGPSVRRYRDKDPNLRRLANDLGVGYALTGAIQREASKLRITARLVRIRDEVQIWSESFDGDAGEVLALEQNVAVSVASAVATQFRRGGSGKLRRPQRINAGAYELYLRGRFYWNQRSESSLKQAVDYFRQAIAEAPDYAPAYAAMADCYAQLVYGCYMAPTEGFAQARAALGRARSLDPYSPEMLASEGYLHMYFDWDFDAAQRKFEEAIRENPNLATAYDWMGVLLTAKEKPDSARATLERARRLDPGSLPITTDLGFQLHYSGRNKQAADTLSRVLARDPNFGPAHFWMGRVLNAEGDCKGARLEFASVPAPLQQWQPLIAARGYVAGVCGDRKGAGSDLSLFEEMAKTRFVTSYGIAVIEAGLGDTEAAILWLRKAVEERSHWMVWIRLDPRFNRMRDDPRFQELVAKVFSHNVLR
jgi:TolB-like protein/DNA-binding winged helix-turn-helix (wHTH) protein/Tfp pilus assembly protein PilF